MVVPVSVSQCSAVWTEFNMVQFSRGAATFYCMNVVLFIVMEFCMSVQYCYMNVVVYECTGI